MQDGNLIASLNNPRAKEYVLPEQMQTNSWTLAVPLVRIEMRTLAIACAAVALVVGLLAAGGYRAASAQADPACEVNDLGTLFSNSGGGLSANGSWTTEDCDSRFRVGSDAHTYRFEVASAGRYRVELKSADADSYLYLLAEDGSRLADDDDGGAGLDARVERDLAPGVYMVEATTVGGRGRGPADFSLSVSRVTGCDPVHLGALKPGVDLTASGSWSLDTCGSGFVVEHPAHRYLFDLPQDGRVLIDLMSTNGDAVMSLVSPTRGVIAANDDGGERRNSRIERYLPAGVYLIEATTYLERDYQPLRADFVLVVQFVDEEARQQSFQLKIEESHTPGQVVAGEPFAVHYRVGNLGGGDLAAVGGSAEVYVVGPRVYDYTFPIVASADRWQAGVSYHSGAQVANATSVAIGEVTPFEATFGRPGPSWVFVGVVTYDRFGQEVGFHGLWRNLMVLSSRTFGPVTVKVDGLDYQVVAEADADGRVTTAVSAAADPDAEVDSSVRAKAIYAAGVRTRVLDGIFERSAIAELSVTEEPAPVDVENPSSSTLLKAFAAQYAGAVAASGLADVLTAGEAIIPSAVEEIALAIAGTSSGQYASLVASWTALQERVNGGEALSFAEAFALQAGLAYAERVLSPAIAAGETVQASRDADLGWQDASVQAMVAGLLRYPSCDDATAVLRGALEAAEVADVDDLIALDAEMRALAPVYGRATDGALCGATEVDPVNSRFLSSLSIAGSAELRELLAPAPPPPAPHRLRIIARLGEDGRIEHGVALSSGQRILPPVRFLAFDATVDQWRISSAVEVAGAEIGKIRTRRLADGRIELGFRTADGEAIEPEIRYLPADLPVDVWLRTSEIEVPPAPESEPESESE